MLSGEMVGYSSITSTKWDWTKLSLNCNALTLIFRGNPKGAIIPPPVVSNSSEVKAIAILLDNKPDIIFINLELTQFSGYDLCSELRQLPYFQDIPIILFSKNINLVDRVKAKMAGCSELFARPLTAQSVLSTIVKYCN